MMNSYRILKNLSLFLFVVTFFSCKSTKTIVAGEVDGSLATKKIIENHYQNALNFETLSGKLKFDYNNGEISQTVSLRFKKDETIWMSAPFGIAKVIITPERVSFYNKLQNEYFDGDFSYLSKLLGTELDFEKVQNLLLGNAVLDLREEKYNSSIINGNYDLEPKKANELYNILFSIEPKNYKIAGQELSQPEEERNLMIQYKYQDVDSNILPNTIAIEAINKDDKTTIALAYRSMEFGRQLSFPYKIPKGFKEIVLE